MTPYFRLPLSAIDLTVSGSLTGRDERFTFCIYFYSFFQETCTFYKNLLLWEGELDENAGVEVWFYIGIVLSYDCCHQFRKGH